MPPGAGNLLPSGEGFGHEPGWFPMQQQVFNQGGAVVEERSGPTVTIHAPAKLNLSLAVLDRRPDGYHEIESLMVPVSLHDTLHVTPTSSPGIHLRVRQGGRLARLGPAFAGDVPDGPGNLVVRAAEALAHEAEVDGGLEIDLLKQIPSGAGLGGGSSDAAAVLQAAADAWHLGWPVDQIGRAHV